MRKEIVVIEGGNAAAHKQRLFIVFRQTEIVKHSRIKKKIKIKPGILLSHL